MRSHKTDVSVRLSQAAEAVKQSSVKTTMGRGDPLQSHVTGKLVRGLGHMRRHNVLCDLSLTCNGVQFTVHKCVLAANSEYFHAMFTNGLEETRAGTVEMHGVEPDALDTLLDIMYGEPPSRLPDEHIEHVMSAAHMLQLDDIYNYCCQILSEKLSCSNYLQVWDLADKYSSSFLQEKVIRFCIKHFRKIVHESEFLALSFERLSGLLASDDLNVTSEDAVLEVVIMWVNAERESRRLLLQQLLTNIRFDLLSMELLEHILEREPWVRESLKALGQMANGISSYLNGGALTISAASNNRKFRNPKASEAILVVFGENQESDIIMQCFSFLRENWYPAKGLPVPMSKMGVTSYRNLVYLIGGFDGNKYLNTVLVYDVVSGRFKCASAMSIKRSDVGVEELDEFIYAVGGYDGHSYLHDVECYDPKQNTWKRAAALLQGRAGVSVAAFNGYLFAIGGYDGKSKAERRVMEYYNPAVDQWTKLVDLEFGLWNAGVGVLDGCLYSVGGYKLKEDGKPAPSAGVMCFSARDRAWTTTHHLPIEAVHTSVVTWDDRLFVMTPQGRLFGYDPCTDRWWELAKAPAIKGDLRGSFAAAALVYRAIQQLTTQ